MPHIVKSIEKATLVKPEIMPGFTDQAFINLIDKLRATNGNKTSVFNLIEDIVNKTITEEWVANPSFDDFVCVKEVPYGR